MKKSALRWISYYFVVLGLVGCNGRPGRIATPNVNPRDAAEAALELYDSDSDEQLSSEELLESPPLYDAMATYDTNKDGLLSKTELVQGIESWAQRGIGAMPLPFKVLLNGRPLAEAQVMLIPAPFLEGVLETASGTTDKHGTGSLQMPRDSRPANVPQHLPVMQPGLYLVKITHPSIDLPAKYNIESNLGLEAGVAGQNPSGITWELRSKKK